MIFWLVRNFSSCETIRINASFSFKVFYNFIHAFRKKLRLLVRTARLARQHRIFPDCSTDSIFRETSLGWRCAADNVVTDIADLSSHDRLSRFRQFCHSSHFFIDDWNIRLICTSNSSFENINWSFADNSNSILDGALIVPKRRCLLFVQIICAISFSCTLF